MKPTAPPMNRGKPGSSATRTPRSSTASRRNSATRSAGQVFAGRLEIPLIDLRHYLEDELDMHHSVASFQTRLRIQREMGHSDNQLIWMTRKPHAPILDALVVGATIEDLDIRDLRSAIAGSSDYDVQRVLGNLERASLNHLRAFSRQLEKNGITYSPEYMDPGEYEIVVASFTEAGKPPEFLEKIAASGVETQADARRAASTYINVLQAIDRERIPYLREFFSGMMLVDLYPYHPERLDEARRHLQNALLLQPRFIQARDVLEQLESRPGAKPQ